MTSMDTAQLERETEQTRAELEGTLDELRAKITPGQMMDQLMDRAREGQAGEFVRNFGRQVTANPLPIAVIGVGLAWLMMANKNPGPRRSADDRAYRDIYGEHMVEGMAGDYQTRRRYAGEVHTGEGSAYRIGEDGSSRPVYENDTYAQGTTGYEAGYDTGYGGEERDSEGRLRSMAGHASDMAHDTVDRLSGTARDARDSLSNTAREARDSLTNMADRSRDRLSDTAASMRGRLQHGASSAREGMHRAASAISHSAAEAGEMSRRFYDFCKEQPLIVAGLGIALGAALGALLPSTRMEDDLVGDASDEVKRRASGIAERARSEAESTWQSTREGVRDTMDRAIGGDGDGYRSGSYRQDENEEGFAAGASGGTDLEDESGRGSDPSKEFETRKPQQDFGSTPTTQYPGAE